MKQDSVASRDRPRAFGPRRIVAIVLRSLLSMFVLAVSVAAVMALGSAQRPQMQKGEDGLFRPRDGGLAEADPAQRIVSGALTASNVNVVNEMVDMIELSRRFELQVEMMKKAEENADVAATIVRPV